MGVMTVTPLSGAGVRDGPLRDRAPRRNAAGVIARLKGSRSELLGPGPSPANRGYRLTTSDSPRSLATINRRCAGSMLKAVCSCVKNSLAVRLAFIRPRAVCSFDARR